MGKCIKSNVDLIYKGLKDLMRTVCQELENV